MRARLAVPFFVEALKHPPLTAFSQPKAGLLFAVSAFCMVDGLWRAPARGSLLRQQKAGFSVHAWRFDESFHGAHCCVKVCRRAEGRQRGAKIKP